MRSLRPLEDVIGGLATRARREILMDFKLDSCIASTKTVIRVLNHYGYDARPLEVRAKVYNAIMVKAIQDGSCPDGNAPEFKRWCDRTGAWSVGIGFPPRPGESYSTAKPWVGHLVVAMPDRGLILDAALDQAARPAKQILIEGMIVAQGVDPEFFTRMDRIVGVENQTGVRILYERIDNRTWKMSPDWVYSKRTDRATEAIIQQIEAMDGDHQTTGAGQYVC